MVKLMRHLNMTHRRSVPFLMAIATTLLGFGLLLALLALTPQYDYVLVSVLFVPGLLAVVILRYYAWKGVVGIRYIALLPPMVAGTLFYYFMGNLLRNGLPAQEYALWHLATLGAAIPTVIALLIALPDILRIFKLVYKQGIH